MSVPTDKVVVRLAILKCHRPYFQDCWYVCHLNENMILPKLSDNGVKPFDVPESCKCTICIKRTCTCRVVGFTCSVFCGCADLENKECQNPHTTGTTLTLPTMLCILSCAGCISVSYYCLSILCTFSSCYTYLHLVLY